MNPKRRIVIREDSRRNVTLNRVIFCSTDRGRWDLSRLVSGLAVSFREVKVGSLLIRTEIRKPSASELAALEAKKIERTNLSEQASKTKARARRRILAKVEIRASVFTIAQGQTRKPGSHRDHTGHH